MSPSASSRKTPNPLLRRKIDRLLSLSIGEELVSSLKEISSVYKQNSLDDRVQLRDLLEDKQLETHQQFLSSYGKLMDDLDCVRGEIAEIEATYNKIASSVQSTMEESGPFIRESQENFLASEQNVIQQKVITAFLDLYQLSPEEEALLLSDTFTGAPYLAACEHLRKIHVNCRQLLQTQHQKAGLEIMDSTRNLLELAYKTIYRWIKSESRTLAAESPSVSSLLVTALKSLNDRAVLLSYCLQEIGDIRNRALKRNFLEALTRGGPNGVPKPIELHAHDPRRYVGDMAAWLHQSLASESELLSTLLQELPQASNEMKKKRAEEKSSILNRALSSVCPLFRERVVQVLATQNSPVLCFRLEYLLDFYRRSFLPLVGPASSLVSTFDHSQKDAHKVFVALSQSLFSRYERTPPIPPSDHSPPHEVLQHVASLSEILEVLALSLVPEEERVVAIEELAAVYLQPFVETLKESGLSLPVASRNVYLINCYSALLEPLRKFPLASGPRDSLSSLMEENVSSLVSVQTRKVFSASELAPFVDEVARRAVPSSGEEGASQKPPPSLASIPSLSSTLLQAGLRKFDKLVLDLSTCLPSTRLILSPAIRQRLRVTVSAHVGASYKQLYEAVVNEASGYQASLMELTPSQVTEVLS